MQGTWLFFPAFLQGVHWSPIELLGDILERPSLTALFQNTPCPALSSHQGVLSVLPTAVCSNLILALSSPCPPRECDGTQKHGIHLVTSEVPSHPRAPNPFFTLVV
jgi:hypothetical protein